jgi:uncharacterized membrane protein
MTTLTWILLIVAALFALTPKWTRPDLYFSVTVQPDFPFTPQARRILRQYWAELALHTVIAFGLTRLAGQTGRAALVGLGWQIIGFTWAVARARRATAQYRADANPVREARLSPRPRGILGGWILALGPLGFLAAAAIYANVAWDRLPERIPVHFGPHGADRWLDKTPAHVYGFLLFLASLCVVFLMVAYGMQHWSRAISITGERARSESRFRELSLWLMIGLQYLVVVPAVLMAFWTTTYGASIWPALIIVVVAIALVALIRLGQGGSRATNLMQYSSPIGDHTPDTAWKWGQFYYNPADPSLIVEKRFGLGYTLNFGNRWSWVLTAALFVPLILSIALR